MRALRAAWIAEHGRGSVVGLAPSAAASQALADDLGVACENTAKWLHEYDHGRTELRRGQLVIVDEATLAGHDDTRPAHRDRRRRGRQGAARRRSPPTPVRRRRRGLRAPRRPTCGRTRTDRDPPLHQRVGEGRVPRAEPRRRPGHLGLRPSQAHPRGRHGRDGRRRVRRLASRLRRRPCQHPRDRVGPRRPRAQRTRTGRAAAPGRRRRPARGRPGRRLPSLGRRRRHHAPERPHASGRCAAGG